VASAWLLCHCVFQQLEVYDTCSFLPSFCCEAEAIIASLCFQWVTMIWEHHYAWFHSITMLSMNHYDFYDTNSIRSMIWFINWFHYNSYHNTIKGAVTCWNGLYPFTFRCEADAFVFSHEDNDCGKDGYKPNQPLDEIGPNQAHVSGVNPSCQAVINHPRAVTSSCQRVINAHTFDLIQLWRYTLSILSDLWGDLWYWFCSIHRLLEHELQFVTRTMIRNPRVYIH
jgi:hypothetical protein